MEGGHPYEAWCLITGILLGQKKRQKGLAQGEGAFEERLPAGIFLLCAVQWGSAFSI